MATTLRAAARDGDWESLTGAARRCRPRATSPGAALVDAVRQPLVRLGRRLRCVVPRRGISLAIVGPDGAGKSTLAASLVAGSALPARAFYMGLHAPVGGAAPMSADSRSRRPLPIRLRRQVRRLLRLTRTALRSELARARGQLVVFDRYTYDADVQWQQARGPGVRLRRWLVRHCARQPDLVVVLDVPASVMFARKREHTHELLEERRLRYLALADTSDRFTVLDGTRPAEELYRIATSLLWNRYVELSASRTIARDGLRAQRREQRRVRERARATEATPAATEARGGARTQP
jgi:thymidylate kinase